MTRPGVGPVTALATVVFLSEYSSGRRQWQGAWCWPVYTKLGAIDLLRNTPQKVSLLLMLQENSFGTAQPRLERQLEHVGSLKYDLSR